MTFLLAGGAGAGGTDGIRKDLVIVWRAFELRPEPVELLEPHGAYLTTVWRDHVYPMAEKMNMPLKMPPIQPRSRLAHEAAKWAGSHDRLAAYNLALFRAFFEFGLDISDMQVLMKLAADMGLDPAALAQVLSSHQYTGEVEGDEEEARKLGIRASAFVCLQWPGPRLRGSDVRSA